MSVTLNIIPVLRGRVFLHAPISSPSLKPGGGSICHAEGCTRSGVPLWERRSPLISTVTTFNHALAENTLKEPRCSGEMPRCSLSRTRSGTAGRSLPPHLAPALVLSWQETAEGCCSGMSADTFLYFPRKTPRCVCAGGNTENNTSVKPTSSRPQRGEPRG